MRLAEIEQSAEAMRVQRMQDTAKAEKDRAKQLKARADASAAQLKARQAVQKLQQSRAPANTVTIKPRA